MGYFEITKDGAKIMDSRLINPPGEAPKGERRFMQYEPITDAQMGMIARLLNISPIEFNHRRPWVQLQMELQDNNWSITQFSKLAGSFLIDKLKELNADVR